MKVAKAETCHPLVAVPLLQATPTSAPRLFTSAMRVRMGSERGLTVSQRFVSERESNLEARQNRLSRRAILTRSLALPDHLLPSPPPGPVLPFFSRPTCNTIAPFLLLLLRASSLHPPLQTISGSYSLFLSGPLDLNPLTFHLSPCTFLTLPGCVLCFSSILYATLA